MLNSTFALTPDHSDGIMVAVRPNDPERFVIEGGYPVEEIHLTLAYMGSVRDEGWDENSPVILSEALADEISPEFRPINGEITAVTTFELAGEDAPPLVLLVDAPGLGHLRDEVVDEIDDVLGDVAVKRNHDFMPHITVAYGASDEEIELVKGWIGEKVRFESVELVWGTESFVHPLGGGIPPSESPDELRSSDASAQFAPLEGDEMPYEIVESHPDCEGDDPFAVVKTEDGQLMGCHDSREDAEEQIVAITIAESEEQGEEAPSEERMAVVEEFLGADEEEFSGAEESVEVAAVEEFGALPSHDTPTVNPPTFSGWNGNEAAKRARSGEPETYYRRIFAWRDPDKNPTAKTSYKFIHHAVSEGGEPGAAVVWAVHAAIAVIDDSTIPTSDYQGVYTHLANHLRDAGVDDIPDLGEDNASIDEVRAAIAHVRGRYLSMVEKAAEAVNISSADDEALVGEVVRRWFESVAKPRGAEASGEFDVDAEEASTDCPCHKGVLEEGATHVDGCPFSVEAEVELAEEEEVPEVSDEAEGTEMITVGDFADNDFDWEGVLIVEGLPSGDGRMIAEGALTWRDLPLPLMLQTVNAPGHDGAVIAGSIHEIERVGHEIIGRGYFDSGESGQELKRLLSEGTMRGVSADIDSVVAELRDKAGNDISMDEMLFDNPADVMEVLVEGRLMGATATPFPAFQEAHLKVLQAAEVDEDVVLVASGAEVHGEVWRYSHQGPFVARGMDPVRVGTLVASAAVEVPSIPVNPPLAWFAAEDDDLDPSMPFTVFPDGRIYGLIAQWGSCHIGYGDRCVQVPRSGNGYSYFRNKNTLTAEGELVATGPIYADTVHPDLKLRASDAQAFYAHTGCAVGDVALYENEHGILAAGAARSDVAAEAIRRLRGSDVSPDWRNIKGRLEVVGVLSVNVSGFIVEGLALAASAGGSPESLTPRARWNSMTGEFDSLVAAGAVRRCSSCGSSNSDEAVLAILEKLNEHSAKIQELSNAVHPYRMERLAARMVELGVTKPGH